MCSAYNGLENGNKARYCGIKEVLPKPIEQKSLKHLLDKYLLWLYIIINGDTSKIIDLLINNKRLDRYNFHLAGLQLFNYWIKCILSFA